MSNVIQIISNNFFSGKLTTMFNFNDHLKQKYGTL